MELVTGKYKQTEFGLIPYDWDLKYFVDVMDGFSSGQTPYRANKKYYRGNIPWITSGELNYNIILDTVEKITPEGARAANLKLIPCGTFLFAITGLEAEGTRGSCAITGIEATTNQSCMALYPKIGKLITAYLFHYYVRYGKPLALEYCQGTKQQSYTGGLAKKLPIILPPTIAEQTAIATALAETDNYITHLEKLIAKKRLIKQGAMQELLRPKEGWVVKKLEEIFNITGGFSASRDQLSVEGYCYLHYGDIHGSLKTYIDCEVDFNSIPKLNIELNKISKKFLLGHGDIVFVDASEDDEGVSRHIVVNNKTNVPFISGLHTIVAKSIDSTINTEYKRYCFQAKYIKDQFKFFAVGTKVSGISKSSIKNINISIPPLNEQIKIAITLGDMDDDIALLEKRLSKVRKIKQGMMQQLLTGKIRLI